MVLLLLLLCLLVFVLHLSINLSYAVRDLQISGPHVCSPTIDVAYLHLRDQHVRNCFIKVTNKTKTSTSLGQRITNYLMFFYLSELLKVFLESLISKIVIEPTNENLVPNTRVSLVLQLGQFPIMSLLIEEFIHALVC